MNFHFCSIGNTYAFKYGGPAHGQLSFLLPTQISRIDKSHDFNAALMISTVPSVAQVLLPLIFLNLHNWGAERDTTKEHEMNSIGLLYLPT